MQEIIASDNSLIDLINRLIRDYDNKVPDFRVSENKKDYKPCFEMLTTYETDLFNFKKWNNMYCICERVLKLHPQYLVYQ